MAIILAIIAVGSVLVAYVMIEKRINLHPCPECGFRGSIDALDEACPRCGSLIPQSGETEAPQEITRRIVNWPMLVFIFVPLLIVSLDAVVLVAERLQPDTEKAIRLVKDSNSRKENFTVQQYLYTTVYYRMRHGEPITIEGWQASKADSDGLMVEFRYTDSAGTHVATWQAELERATVAPKNEAAVEMSWH